MTRFFIGSDNSTGRIDQEYLERIERTAFMFSEGFTLYRARGGWQGKIEDSAVLEIEGISQKRARMLVKRLKDELKQDAIGVQHLPSVEFV